MRLKNRLNRMYSVSRFLFGTPKFSCAHNKEVLLFLSRVRTKLCDHHDRKNAGYCRFFGVLSEGLKGHIMLWLREVGLTRRID